MHNKYENSIFLLAKRKSLGLEEAKELIDFIRNYKNAYSRKHETELFQNIAIQLGAIFPHKFTFEKHFGAGGFAYTDLVKSKQNGKRYIMKYLHYDKTFVVEYKERFVREIINTLFVEHPNIPRVVYFGKSPIKKGKNSYYYVMDYIEGHDFREYIFTYRGDNFAEIQKRLLIGFTDVLKAMDFLHSNQIYHRDCTLSNMILDVKNNKSYLIDLGLSKEFQDTITVTDSDSVHGSPAYLAPEYLMDGHYSVATDIYTLGASLYSLITRRFPHDLFPDKLGGICGKMRTWLYETQDPLLLTDLRNPAFSIFGSIIRKSTAFNSEDRYPSIQIFLKDYINALKKLYQPTKAPAR